MLCGEQNTCVQWWNYCSDSHVLVPWIGVLLVKFMMEKCSDAQLYPTLCNSMDCSPPGSSVHGILLARILEWVAIASSRG